MISQFISFSFFLGRFRKIISISLILNSLSVILSDYNKLDDYQSVEIIKKSISENKTPIKFLKSIQKSAQ